MTMTDPVADMFVRIRNAQARKKPVVSMPASKLKAAIARVLKDEGYITDFSVSREGGKDVLSVGLKYFEGRPVIEELRRVSRPGLRVYRGADEYPRVRGGLGIAILSTPRGLMTDRAARQARCGGEVLCVVS